MGRDGKSDRNRKPRSMKGFRPGKEPEHLRKKRAKARLGKDATWAQKKAIDAVAGRSPDEVRKLVGRWTKILLAVALALAVAGALLYRWSLAAGIAVHVLAFAAGFLWLRLRTQREELVKMAEWVRQA